MIYWVAALQKAKKKKDEKDEDRKEELLLSPRAITAKNDRAAAFKVARMKDLASADPDRVEILVRPF